MPGGVPGLEVDFSGAGPGAAHHLSHLLRSSIELRAAVIAEQARAARACEDARRTRALLQ